MKLGFFFKKNVMKKFLWVKRLAKYFFAALRHDALHSSAGVQALPHMHALVAHLWANNCILIDAIIVTRIWHNCKRKCADLLRRFFNYWTDAGNPAKIIKRRFRDELRAHNTPIIILVKHITIFALEVARLSNKSIFHVIILHIFINLTFPAVFPCAICFIWRCTSSNNARTIITAFLVSSRSPVLLADDTSGIVRSIPKTVTITAYKADFHALQTIII